MQWSGCRSRVASGQRMMALPGKEVGRGRRNPRQSTSNCPCDRPETLNISLSQKGLNLETKITHTKVVYLFHPRHNFSKKQKARQCQVVRRLWELECLLASK